MNVLALNCGSSSLKFQVFARDPGALPAGVRRLVRGLVERIENDNSRARLAVEVSCHRARKYLGAYLAILGGGADAAVFSGGIGEHAPEVRARICAGMAWCGLVLEAERNSAAVGREARLTPDGARLATYVIQADEERVIAQDPVERLTRTAESR